MYPNTPIQIEIIETTIRKAKQLMLLVFLDFLPDGRLGINRKAMQVIHISEIKTFL
jgi:hypothetical protein